MRIDVRRHWKYPLGLALGGVLLPASMWVTNGLVPDKTTTVAAAAAGGAPAPQLPDSALESRLLRQTAEQVAQQRLAAEQAAAEAAAKKLAEEQAAKAARAAAREAAARERASRNAARPRPAEAASPAPAPQPGGDDVWARLRRCEAGGVYSRNSGNGYYGAYQFSAGTWRSLGYHGLPHEAPPEVQDEAARKLQARSGWGQWPACSRRIGAR